MGESLSLLSTTQSILSFPQVPNLVFLAVSPEEKESWVNALNTAIIKAKNRIFDEVGQSLFSSPSLSLCRQLSLLPSFLQLSLLFSLISMSLMQHL